MSKFIKSIISRHASPELNVKPRLRGRFEATENNTNASIIEESTVLEKTVNTTSELAEQVESKSFPEPLESTEEQITTDLPTPVITGKNEEDLVIVNQEVDGQVPEIENGLTEAVLPDEKAAIEAPFLTGTDQKTFPEHLELTADWIDNSNVNAPEEKIPSRKSELLSVNHKSIERLNISDTTTVSNEHNDLLEEEQLVFDESYTPLINQSILPAEKVKTTELPPFSAGQNKEHGGLLISENFQSLPIAKEAIQPLSKASETPIIKVSIGQINIRSRTQAAPPVQRKRTPPAKPKMSLSDYLKKQNQ